MWRAFLIVLALSVPAPVVAQEGTAEPLAELDIPTARRLGVVLLNNGEPRAALAIAEALLAENPRDVEALIILSRAQRTLGEPKIARQAAVAAYRYAESDELRFVAALSAAQAWSTEGNRGIAQFWLRRAVQVAPTEAARARAINDYRYVAERNPWDVSLSFGITPTNNVNGGPTTTLVEVGDLIFTNPTARPISGYEIGSGISLTYRLTEAQTRRSLLTFGYHETRVVLGDEAATINPDLSADDLTYQHLSLGWRLDRKAGPDAPLTSLSLAFARDHSGLEPLSNTFSIAYRERYTLNPQNRLTWSVDLSERDRFDDAARSSTDLTVDLGWTRRGETGQMLLQGNVARHDSSSRLVDRRGYGVSLSYTFAEPIMASQMTLTAAVQTTDYTTPSLTPEARADQTTTLRAEALVKGLEYYGFAPVIAAEYRRNRSNYLPYDTETIGVDLGIRSTN